MSKREILGKHGHSGQLNHHSLKGTIESLRQLLLKSTIELEYTNIDFGGFGGEGSDSKKKDGKRVRRSPPYVNRKVTQH